MPQPQHETWHLSHIFSVQGNWICWTLWPWVTVSGWWLHTQCPRMPVALHRLAGALQEVNSFCFLILTNNLSNTCLCQDRWLHGGSLTMQRLTLQRISKLPYHWSHLPHWLKRPMPNLSSLRHIPPSSRTVWTSKCAPLSCWHRTILLFGMKPRMSFGMQRPLKNKLNGTVRPHSKITRFLVKDLLQKLTDSWQDPSYTHLGLSPFTAISSWPPPLFRRFSKICSAKSQIRLGRPFFHLQGGNAGIRWCDLSFQVCGHCLPITGHQCSLAAALGHQEWKSSSHIMVNTTLTWATPLLTGPIMYWVVSASQQVPAFQFNQVCQQWPHLMLMVSLFNLMECQSCLI